ncbi:phospholipase C type enzyme [Cryptotrichosporon argae]
MSNPALSSADTQIRILSFNVWGLAFVAKDRPARIRAIADYLASAPYDVVCLQEIWIYADFEVVRDAVLPSLPFSRFFHTGALGSGLAIFSRYPFVSARALPYALSGLPHHATAGDFYVNKAAGCVVLLHPALGEVEVWNTHMHAGGEHPPDTQQAHRMAQAWQLASEVRGGAAKGRYIFAMGDFNSQPFSIPIAILRTHGDLADSFLDTHPGCNDVGPVTPADGLGRWGMTCDSSLNTYSAGKNISPHIDAQGGKRLDYIFHRGPEVARRRPLVWGYRDDPDIRHGGEASDEGRLEEGKPIPSSVRNAPTVRCVKSEVVLTGLVPGESFSYSDHFGLASTFAIDLPDKRGSTGSAARTDATATSFTPLLPLISDPDPLNPTTTTFTAYSPPAAASTSTASVSSASSPASAKQTTLRSALNTLRLYTRVSRAEATRHQRLLAAAAVALAGLAVGSAWQPKPWLQPIFTLLGGALGAAAASYLYLWFIWGRWEQGLLTETIEEMELELRVVEMEDRTGTR